MSVGAVDIAVVVDPAVSLAAVRQELVLAEDFATATGILIDATPLGDASLRFYATFRNGAGELFYLEFDCRNYPLHPPTIECVDAERRERGLARLYPAGFHTMPCICARYNRKAYRELGGPHGDWRLIDWQLGTPNGGPIDSLAMMLSDLQAKIAASTGRLG